MTSLNVSRRPLVTRTVSEILTNTAAFIPPTLLATVPQVGDVKDNIRRCYGVINASSAAAVEVENGPAEGSLKTSSRQKGTVLRLNAGMVEDWNSNTDHLKFPNKEGLLAPVRRRRAEEDRLKEKIKKENLKNVEPHPFASVETAVMYQGYIPMVLAGFTFTWNDIEVGAIESRCIWDSGSHKIRISEDLVPKAILDTIRNSDDFEEHRIFLADNKEGVRVTGYISFGTDGPLPFLCAFDVVPRDCMPNGFSGVLLGQYTFLDSLLYKSIPIRTAKVFHPHLVSGDDVNDDGLWGYIEMDGFVSSEGEVFGF